MIGADDVALVNQSQVAEYRSLLLKLPKNYDPKDFDRSLNELLEQAKTLPPDKVGRQGSTLNRHLTQLKSVIEYIETSGKSVGDYKGVHKLRAKVVTRTRDARAILPRKTCAGFLRGNHGRAVRAKRTDSNPARRLSTTRFIGCHFSRKRGDAVGGSSAQGPQLRRRGALPLEHPQR